MSYYETIQKRFYPVGPEIAIGATVAVLACGGLITAIAFGAIKTPFLERLAGAARYNKTTYHFGLETGVLSGVGAGLLLGAKLHWCGSDNEYRLGRKTRIAIGAAIALFVPGAFITYAHVLKQSLGAVGGDFLLSNSFTTAVTSLESGSQWGFLAAASTTALGIGLLRTLPGKGLVDDLVAHLPS